MSELKGLFLSLKCHKEGKNGVKSIFSHKQKQKGCSQPWRTEYNPSKDQQQCISTTTYEEKKKEQEHSGKLTPAKELGGPFLLVLGNLLYSKPPPLISPFFFFSSVFSSPPSPSKGSPPKYLQAAPCLIFLPFSLAASPIVYPPALCHRNTAISLIHNGQNISMPRVKLSLASQFHYLILWPPIMRRHMTL